MGGRQTGWQASDVQYRKVKVSPSANAPPKEVKEEQKSKEEQIKSIRQQHKGFKNKPTKQ